MTSSPVTGPPAEPGHRMPTLQAVLGLPPLAAGRPRVLSGDQSLGAPVRWAHVVELPEIGPLLRGGELVLTTGVALPAQEAGRLAFLRELAAVPVAGLVVELGHAFVDRVPEAMVRQAQQLGLVLVELTREVAFVEITEAVHALVLDAQLEQLRSAQAVHETFTDLSLEGAPAEVVLRQAARLARTAVVLENLSHQVLAHDAAGGDAAQLLSRWETRSRRTRPALRTGWDAATGLLVTTVGARGQDWGRLLMVRESEPEEVDLLVIERAAATLALNRLLTRDAESLERQTHRSLLAAVLNSSEPPSDVLLRARALGVPLEGRRLIGALVRPGGMLPGALEGQARLRDLGDAVAQAIRACDVNALVGPLDDRTIGVLAALGARDREADLLPELAVQVRRAVRARLPAVDADRLVLTAGSVVGGPRDARRSLTEATQVADAAVASRATAAGRRADTGPSPGFIRITDLRLRGLLQLLRDDPRLRTFTERELAPLLAHDDATGENLVATLRAYLDAGRNKSTAAARSHVSRPAFYDRLARVGRLLGADLGDVETCLSLHVALIARDLR